MRKYILIDFNNDIPVMLLDSFSEVQNYIIDEDIPANELEDIYVFEAVEFKRIALKETKSSREIGMVDYEEDSEERDED